MRPLTNYIISIVILVVIAAAVLLTWYGPLGIPPGSQVEQPSVKTLNPEYTITLQNNSYDPQNLTVIAGTNVTWTNPADSAQVYSVVSDDLANGTRVFDSGPINAGQSFSFTFNDPGTFQYGSSIQYYINGTITVVPNAPENVSPGTSQPTGPEGFPV